MLRKLAVLFGIVFVAVGVLGFVPGVTTNEHLLGIFHVNAAHNLVHIVSGVIAIMAGLATEHASRLYFRWFGLVYAIVAILGLVQPNREILGVISNNYADVILHFSIAIMALVIGFAVRERTAVLDH